LPKDSEERAGIEEQIVSLGEEIAKIDALLPEFVKPTIAIKGEEVVPPLGFPKELPEVAGEILEGRKGVMREGVIEKRIKIGKEVPEAKPPEAKVPVEEKPPAAPPEREAQIGKAIETAGRPRISEKQQIREQDLNRAVAQFRDLDRKIVRRNELIAKAQAKGEAAVYPKEEGQLSEMVAKREAIYKDIQKYFEDYVAREFPEKAYPELSESDREYMVNEAVSGALDVNIGEGHERITFALTMLQRKEARKLSAEELAAKATAEEMARVIVEPAPEVEGAPRVKLYPPLKPEIDVEKIGVDLADTIEKMMTIPQEKRILSFDEMFEKYGLERIDKGMVGGESFWPLLDTGKESAVKGQPITPNFFEIREGELKQVNSKIVDFMREAKVRFTPSKNRATLTFSSTKVVDVPKDVVKYFQDQNMAVSPIVKPKMVWKFEPVKARPAIGEKVPTGPQMGNYETLYRIHKELSQKGIDPEFMEKPIWTVSKDAEHLIWEGKTRSYRIPLGEILKDAIEVQTGKSAPGTKVEITEEFFGRRLATPEAWNTLGIDLGFMGFTPQNMKLLYNGMVKTGKYVWTDVPKALRMSGRKLGITKENFGRMFNAVAEKRRAVTDQVKGWFQKVWTHMRGFWQKERPPEPERLPTDAVEKLTALLKRAKPVRRKIERQYTRERGRRIREVEKFIEEKIGEVGGEEGYRAVLSKLKGELIKPEAKIVFEPFKDKITDAELKDIYLRTWKHPYLDNWEKISTVEGLTRLLSGEIPQPKQLVLLEEVYGSALVKGILSKRLWGARTRDFLVEAANIPRSLLATADMSAFLRQGIIPVVAHPIISAKAVGKTFRFAFSPKSFRQYFEDLPNDPMYPLMRKSKLAITDPSKAGMIGREEPFISHVVQKIPVLGIPTRFAERAYVGFLNKVRVDLFKSWAEELTTQGMSPVKDADIFKSAASVVNTFTGRGSVGRLERITPEMNVVFFSPRLITARFNALNPHWYIKQPKEIRKKAIGDFAKFVSVGVTTLALMKMYADANPDSDMTIETDPRSSDFGKIRIGNTRWDIWGGFQQWARVFTQFITGERKTTTTGEIVSLTKDAYPFSTRKEVALRFVEGKLAPVPALINELISGGKTFEGEEITWETISKEKLVPMYIQDIAEAYEEGGLGRAIGVGIPIPPNECAALLNIDGGT